MPELVRMPRQASNEEILEALGRDGALIVEGLLDAPAIERVRSEIMPYVDATPPGSDEFAGFETTRTGALVARSPACRELVMHPTVVETARAFLSPFCARIQLHLTQVIRIRPGQKEQLIHRDRWAWGTHLQHVEPQCNTIWAITPFTHENGATRVAPGSVGWPDDRRPTEDELTCAEMEPGSVLIYTGSVFHGGGANRSREDRIGLNLTYSLAWLRQEENQYLSCPPEVARHLEPELQALLGYSMGSYALGYYTPPLPPGKGPELVGPEHALGRPDDPADPRLGSAELLEQIKAETGA